MKPRRKNFLPAMPIDLNTSLSGTVVALFLVSMPLMVI